MTIKILVLNRRILINVICNWPENSSIVILKDFEEYLKRMEKDSTCYSFDDTNIDVLIYNQKSLVCLHVRVSYSFDIANNFALTIKTILSSSCNNRLLSNTNTENEILLFKNVTLLTITSGWHSHHQT